MGARRFASVRAIFPGYNPARSIGSCGYIGTPVNGKRPILKSGMDKRTLSERDICTKYITPAIKRAGWDEMLQIREEVGFTKLVTRGKAKRAGWDEMLEVREEVYFTKGRIIVRGKLVTRG